MKAKEYLSQAYRLDQRIDAKIEQVMSLRNLAAKATSTLSDAAPSGTRNVHRMEDIIIKIIDFENEINADIDNLVDLKREIMAAIRSIHDPDYCTVLETAVPLLQVVGTDCCGDGLWHRQRLQVTPDGIKNVGGTRKWARKDIELQ